PAVGLYTPVIMLKNVVLPAPFGPMRLTIDRRGIVKSTSLTATRPPNSFRRPTVSSRRSVICASGPCAALHVHQRLVVDTRLDLQLAALFRDQTSGAEEHHQDDDRAVDPEREQGRVQAAAADRLGWVLVRCVAREDVV